MINASVLVQDDDISPKPLLMSGKLKKEVTKTGMAGFFKFGKNKAEQESEKIKL